MYTSLKFELKKHAYPKIPRIILIDVDIKLVQSLRESAKKLGVSVTGYCCVRDVRQELADWKFDLAIIDYELEIATGIQVANFLGHWVKPIPILMLMPTSSLLVVGSPEFPAIVKGKVYRNSPPERIIEDALKLYKEFIRELEARWKAQSP